MTAERQRHTDERKTLREQLVMGVSSARPDHGKPCESFGTLAAIPFTA